MAEKPASTPGEKPTEPASTSATAPVVPVVATKPAETAPATTPPPETKPPETKPAETPPAAATKPPEEKPPETKPAETPPAAADVVPEKYELTGAEGNPVDPPLVEALTPIFKEAGVKAGQAQALINAYTAYAKTVPALIAQRDLEALRADPELGKLNFGRTVARVNQALSAFTLPDERAALERMGMANNPVLVRMFHRIGLAMSDPQQTDAGPRAPEPASRASKLYGGGDMVAPKPN